MPASQDIKATAAQEIGFDVEDIFHYCILNTRRLVRYFPLSQHPQSPPSASCRTAAASSSPKYVIIASGELTEPLTELLTECFPCTALSALMSIQLHSFVDSAQST
jgi:hypothetical protein